MKRKILAAVLFCVGCFAFAQEKLNVIFMHDVHSFLDETARAKVQIDELTSLYPESLIVDAGDFSMGTLYQTVFSTKAAELQMLGALGVEATTFGNHEFDFGGQRLADMFTAAKNSGNPVPQFVVCNVDWSQPDAFTQTLKKSLDDYGTADYIMIRKGSLNVAVIGVLGKNAVFCSTENEFHMLNQIESVKRTVAQIKANEKADAIVLLSHSGTNKNKSKSEDYQMAKAVPELDLIVSAHTHTVLEEPLVVGDTTIVSCGAYYANLGTVTLSRTEKGRWTVSDYKLYPMKDDSLPEDADMAAMLKSFGDCVDSEYLSRYGYTSRQVIAYADRDLEQHIEMGYCLGELMRYGINEAGYDVDMVVVPVGMKRERFTKGVVTVSDAFESYSLGIGKDGLAGYPFIYAYISGKDVKNLCEIDCSLSSVAALLNLFMTGISYDYNPYRGFLNQVTDVYLMKDGVRTEKLDDNKMYSIAVDYYTSLFLGQISDRTKGFITITPYDKEGNVITDFADAIMYDTAGNEVKCWVSVARGLEHLGIPANLEDRRAKAKVEKVSWNPVKILIHPSAFAVLIRFVLLVIILLIVLFIVLVKRGKKRRNAVAP